MHCLDYNSSTRATCPICSTTNSLTLTKTSIRETGLRYRPYAYCNACQTSGNLSEWEFLIKTGQVTGRLAMTSYYVELSTKFNERYRYAENMLKAIGYTESILPPNKGLAPFIIASYEEFIDLLKLGADSEQSKNLQHYLDNLESTLESNRKIPNQFYIVFPQFANPGFIYSFLLHNGVSFKGTRASLVITNSPERANVPISYTNTLKSDPCTLYIAEDIKQFMNILSKYTSYQDLPPIQLMTYYNIFRTKMTHKPTLSVNPQQIVYLRSDFDRALPQRVTALSANVTTTILDMRSVNMNTQLPLLLRKPMYKKFDVELIKKRPKRQKPYKLLSRYKYNVTEDYFVTVEDMEDPTVPLKKLCYGLPRVIKGKFQGYTLYSSFAFNKQSPYKYTRIPQGMFATKDLFNRYIDAKAKGKQERVFRLLEDFPTESIVEELLILTEATKGFYHGDY